MKVVRKRCPDPIKSGEYHHHWRIISKKVKIYPNLWWDWDRKNFGSPIEVGIFTSKKYWLIRPFSKSQGWDWKEGKAKDWRDKKNWKHITSSPVSPEKWKALCERDEYT